jgi:hypothetical protein
MLDGANSPHTVRHGPLQAGRRWMVRIACAAFHHDNFNDPWVARLKRAMTEFGVSCPQNV